MDSALAAFFAPLRAADRNRAGLVHRARPVQPS